MSTTLRPWSLSRCRFLPLLVLLSVLCAGNAVEQDDLPCSLQCQNGGTCSRKQHDTAKALEIDVANGRMLESCTCPEGWTGMVCTESSFKGQDYHCNKVAQEASQFAGNQCRFPATEYCYPYRSSPSEALLSYCTHGGKCLNQIHGAIQDETAKAHLPYQHLGCRCPPEFTGTHCEVLRPLLRDSDDKPHTATVVVVPVVAALLFVGLLAVLVVRHKKNRNSTTMASINLQDMVGRTGSDGGNGDDRMRAMPVSSSSPILRSTSSEDSDGGKKLC